MDNFENFYNEYKKTKLDIYNQFCFACQEKYVQSLKYHTCYYATGGTDDENIDLVLQIIFIYLFYLFKHILIANY